jgi:hypothetical protein
MAPAGATAASAVDRFFQFTILGLVCSGFLAVAGSGFLDVPTIAAVGAGLLLRSLLIARVLRLDLTARIVNILTLAYICFFAADYFFLSHDLLTATVHLVFFLAVIKILTARTNRDYLYTAAIALIELIAAALLSANMNFFVFLAMFLLCAIGAFTSGEIRRSLEKSKRVALVRRVRFAPRLAVLTAFATAAILILTAGLFILLPRTANAALRFTLSSRYHLSGFSSEVLLGQVGEIQKDSRVVMHVRPYSSRMPGNLKWRGAALSHFDGRRWSDLSSDGRVLLPPRTPIALADERQFSRTDGARFSYRVDLDTGDSDALFFAGIPEYLNIDHARVIRTASGGFRLGASPTENVRYEVSSFVPHRVVDRDVHLTRTEQGRYLQLPPLDPRIPVLAREWAGAEIDPWQVESRLRSAYPYTLELPEKEPADPLATFLFERKKGHCEYFASAMTVMLRSLGIPARIVNGFQGGKLNRYSGLLVVRASDAHSWVEAFLDGKGWTVFDPTPGALLPVPEGIFAKMSMMLDAAGTFWREWVINYDLGRQLLLAERLQETGQRVRWGWNPSIRGWRAGVPHVGTAPIVLLAIGLLAAMLAPMLARWKHTRKIRGGSASSADATLLYRRMLRIIEKRGFSKPPWFTPAEFAATLPASPTAAIVGEFTERYQALRFGGDGASAPKLGELLAELERSRN